MAMSDLFKQDLTDGGFTPSQVEAIASVLNETYYNSDGYDYADNLRIARVGNTEEVLRYEESKRNGCCGYFDREIAHPDGNILLGFNYGH
jgi:hypothetical protein